MKNLLFATLLILVSTTSFAEQDPRAIALANATLEAMGGKTAYNNTRYLTWRFFGGRRHVWDKYYGDVRIEDGNGLIVIMNINSNTGKAWLNGNEIVDKTTLKEKLKFGYEAWINDAYWLVMPYKLLDPGVTLRYTREDKTEDGRTADVLTLTFGDVGVTPENKYEVFVDKKSKLVTQWKFFAKASDNKARFTTPWAQWKNHGNIMLSADRGKKGHTEVAVLSEVPASTFTSPETLTLELPDVK